MAQGKTSAEILQQFLEIPGLQGICIIGRDGFVLDVAGNLGRINNDALGASVALVYKGVEDMGRDLAVVPTQTITIEYAGAMIICQPVADAICATVCPDSKTLGVIRHKVKTLLPNLAQFY